MGKLIGGGGGKKDRGMGGDSDEESPTVNGAAVSSHCISLSCSFLWRSSPFGFIFPNHKFS